ncbi:MAG: hypothetical protein SVP26_04205, partial [Chloroflexota bacterium]|nr:hypothetical protein [Chloroflexota bacterium]
MNEVSEKRLSMENWVAGLLVAFRREYEKLTESEQGRLSNLDNLVAPCQVEVLWVGKTDWYLDCQVLMFSHFSDIKDGGVVVHGPVVPRDAVEAMKGIMAEPKWQRTLKQEESFVSVLEGDGSYASVLEGPFADGLDRLRTLTIHHLFSSERPVANIDRKTGCTKDVFFWLVSGDVRTLPVEQVVDKIIESARRQPPALEKRELQPKPPVIEGFATFFYPPVWIGALPTRAIEERLTSQRAPSIAYPDKALDVEYKGTIIVIHQDG